MDLKASDIPRGMPRGLAPQHGAAPVPAGVSGPAVGARGIAGPLQGLAAKAKQSPGSAAQSVPRVSLDVLNRGAKLPHVDLSLPKIKLPDIDLPLPEINLPDIGVPRMKLPSANLSGLGSSEMDFVGLSAMLGTHTRRSKGVREEAGGALQVNE